MLGLCVPNHTFTKLGQLILVRQKRTRSNNADTFFDHCVTYHMNKFIISP